MIPTSALMTNGQKPFPRSWIFSFMEALNKWLRRRIAALRGARFLAYLFDMSRSLRATRLALHPSHSLIWSFLSVKHYIRFRVARYLVLLRLEWCESVGG